MVEQRLVADDPGVPRQPPNPPQHFFLVSAPGLLGQFLQQAAQAGETRMQHARDPLIGIDVPEQQGTLRDHPHQVPHFDVVHDAVRVQPPRGIPQEPLQHVSTDEKSLRLTEPRLLRRAQVDLLKALGNVVQGDRDEMVPQESVQKLVDKLSLQKSITIDYQIVKGANHFFQDDAVAPLIQSVEKYLDANLAPTAA